MKPLKRSLIQRIKKRADTSVVIPALNEAASIGQVIRLAFESRRVGEVVVVDDGSVDDTADIARHAGAKVIFSTHLGKGASMADGLNTAGFPYVCFLDADLEGLTRDSVDLLVKPIAKGQAQLVKGYFSRTQGRVTELVAKPLLHLFFPELNAVKQPLSGQMAIKRELGSDLRFENDYGVDVGLLIDIAMAGAKVIEVDLGRLEHRHHDLRGLSSMAFQVTQTILQRAQHYGRIDGESLQVMSSVQRQMEAALEGFARLGGNPRTVLLSLDGVLSDEHFIDMAASELGAAQTAKALLKDENMTRSEKTEAIARLMTGVPQDEIARIAGNMPLRAGAVEAVIDLKRLGYTVGVLSDGFLLPAEVGRRRVFADFSVGHMLEYQRGACTGKVFLAEAFRHPSGCKIHTICTSNILPHLKEKSIEPAGVVAVGSTASDACLLAASGLGIAYRSRDEACGSAADIRVESSGFDEVVERVAALSPAPAIR